MMKKFSRALLVVQFLILGLISLFAVLLSGLWFFLYIQKIGDPVAVSNAVVSAIGIYSVFSGYEFFRWVLRDGPKLGDKLSRSCLFGLIVGASMVVSGWVYMIIFNSYNPESLFFYAAFFGLVYVPTAIHLCVEIYFQIRANKSSMDSPCVASAK